MAKVSTFAALLAFQVLIEELEAKVKLLVITAPPVATFDADFEVLAMAFPPLFLQLFARPILYL